MAALPPLFPNYLPGPRDSASWAQKPLSRDWSSAEPNLCSASADAGAARLHLVLSSWREGGRTEERFFFFFLVKRKMGSPKLCTQTVISDCMSKCYLEGNAARRWPGKAWQRLQADFFFND